MVDDQILRQLRQALRQDSSAVTVHNPEEAPVMGRPERQPVDGPDGWHLFLREKICIQGVPQGEGRDADVSHCGEECEGFL